MLVPLFHEPLAMRVTHEVCQQVATHGAFSASVENALSQPREKQSRSLVDEKIRCSTGAAGTGVGPSSLSEEVRGLAMAP